MKLKENEIDTLFKLFLFTVVELFCISVYIIISALSGDFNWTVERLTSSFGGMVIQILQLVVLINGVIIFMYIVIFLILHVKN